MKSTTPTTADHAYLKLRDLLISGELKPGQKVAQLKLARLFQCSPAPVVEAMRRLESEGLLVKQPRKMATVRMLSAADLEGLYMLREGIETITAKLCALRIDATQIKTLKQLNASYESAMAVPDHHDIIRLDIAIHKLIAQASGCPLLAEELDRMLLIERTAGQSHQSNYQENMRNAHRALIRAIVDRDEDSAQYLMKKHIQSGYQFVLSTIRARTN